MPDKELSSVHHQHHWREGNLPGNSKCAVCKKTCWSAECLVGYRCEWCGITVSIIALLSSTVDYWCCMTVSIVVQCLKLVVQWCGMMVSIFYLLICTPEFVVIVVVVAFVNERFSVRRLQADNLPWVL